MFIPLSHSCVTEASHDLRLQQHDQSETSMLGVVTVMQAQKISRLISPQDSNRWQHYALEQQLHYSVLDSVTQHGGGGWKPKMKEEIQKIKIPQRHQIRISTSSGRHLVTAFSQSLPA